MKVAYFPKQITKKPTTLVLGGFNGFHNGHYELLKKALSFKKPIAFMIVDHPEKKEVFSSLETRLNHLASLKVNCVSIVRLTLKQKSVKGYDFLKTLVSSVNAKHIVMGKDFACGQNRLYKAQDIQKDFDATIVDHKKVNDAKLSTSLLKEMVRTGEVDVIKKVSPFYYEIEVHIDHNLFFNFKDYIVPQKGIYAVKAIVNEIEYWAIVHIGFDFNKLIVPDLKIKNSGFYCKILFVKLTRKIFSTNNDQLKEEDKDLASKYLSTF